MTCLRQVLGKTGEPAKGGGRAGDGLANGQLSGAEWQGLARCCMCFRLVVLFGN
jgi:hypothetical protein